MVKGKKRKLQLLSLSSLSTLGLCTGGGSGSAHVKGRIASGGGRGRQKMSLGCHAALIGRSSRRSEESRIVHHSTRGGAAGVATIGVGIATVKGLPTGDDARGARRGRGGG